MINIKLESTQLIKNIKELQCRTDERTLYAKILDRVEEFVPNKINAIYLTTIILNIIRNYKL